MSTQSGPRDKKLNRLLQRWLPGTVLTPRALDELGIYRQLISKYLRNGWVEKLGTGAYARAGDRVDWRGGLYALQTQLAMTIHVGARSALELQGRAHFVPLGSNPRITLISDSSEHLPAWFRDHSWDATLKHYVLTLFDELPEGATSLLDCGSFQITMASAERAIMEEMRLARTNADIEHAIQLMENLTALRPLLVQRLLERCTSVKVKRLFLWSAEDAVHPWLDRVELVHVDLGSGKRQLVKGGRLDPKYRITVPQREDQSDA